MLIKFTVQNWESINEPITLSMEATREKQHGERLPKIESYDLRLLPVAVIYGANASGKTKICNALRFAQDFITTITQPDSPIDIITFKLDKTLEEKPTKFSFQILANETCYEFNFSVNSKKVLEEELIKYSSSSQKTLFSRNINGNILFDASLHQDQRLRFIAEGTRDNELFLTKTVDQKIPAFLPVYNWFKKNLVVIGPNSKPTSWNQFMDKENISVYSEINSIIANLDTGITQLDGIDIQLSKEDETKIASFPEGQEILINNILFSKKNGKLITKKIVSYHKNSDGNNEQFNLTQESDGTIRMIELLPAIIDLCNANSNKTYIIDEFDRSLHTLLVTSLLEYYFQTCSQNSRSQLIFTTHNTMLMEQDIFRRDEIWITERNKNSATQLFSLSDFRGVRSDKDIRKSYLKGSFGGIPNIVLNYNSK